MDSRPQHLIIEPTGIGEVLDTGIRLGRQNYGFLLRIAAWGTIPAAVFDAIANAAGLSQEQGAAEIAASVLGRLAFAVLAAVASIAVARAAAHLIDPSVSFTGTGQAYSAALGRFLPVLLLTIVAVLAAVPLIIVLPLGIYILVRWSQSWLALVLEPIGPLGALRRSWQLTARSWWHTAVVLFTAGLILGVISAVLGAAFGAVGGLSGFLAGGPFTAAYLAALGQMLSSLLLTPFSIAIYVVLYYELRAREEGFDLVQRAILVGTGR
jgi:hypothetical protein